MASTLPQTTRVHFAVQRGVPVGYDASAYGGPWPACDVQIIKLSFPSTMKSSANRSNFHTVTLLVSLGLNSTNHLNLGKLLEPIIGYFCDCESGMRTNAACCHVEAACIVLFCPSMFRSAKKKEARLNDIRRPETQRPLSSGPPANNRNIDVFVSPASSPARRTRDTRRNQRNVFVQSFQSPNQQTSSSTSPSSSPARQRPRLSPSILRQIPLQTNQRQQQQQGDSSSASSINHPSGLGNLLNIQNTCYAASCLQLLLAADMHLNIDLTNRDNNHQNLDTTFIRLCMDRDNPAIRPFSMVPLVTAFNTCLSAQDRFSLPHQHCAADFLGKIFEHLEIQIGFICVLYEQGTCIVCNSNVMQLSQAPYMLEVTIPQQQPAVSLSTHIGAAITNPIAGLSCRSQGPCYGQPLPGTMSIQPGNCFFAHVNRNSFGTAAKILTPLIEPQDNDIQWQGKSLLAVLAHEGRTVRAGHWLAFVKVGRAWFRLDSSQPQTIRNENPFTAQIALPTNQNGYTIDILVFK